MKSDSLCAEAARAALPVGRAEVAAPLHLRGIGEGWVNGQPNMKNSQP